MNNSEWWKTNKISGFYMKACRNPDFWICTLLEWLILLHIFYFESKFQLESSNRVELLFNPFQYESTLNQFQRAEKTTEIWCNELIVHADVIQSSDHLINDSFASIHLFLPSTGLLNWFHYSFVCMLFGVSLNSITKSKFDLRVKLVKEKVSILYHM